MTADCTWAFPWGWNDERERSEEPYGYYKDYVSGPVGQCAGGPMGPDADDTYGPHCARRDHEPRESIYAYASDWPRCRCGVWCWCDPGQLEWTEDTNA